MIFLLINFSALSGTYNAQLVANLFELKIILIFHNFIISITT